jgi:peptidoglycan hydrolase-like protein with peptidoglycan-binding domain
MVRFAHDPAMDNRPLLQQPEWNDPHTAHVQRILEGLGFYGGLIDGDFGPITDAAVRDFQAWQGLKVDGKVGDKTWAALDAAEVDYAIQVIQETPDQTYLRFVDGLEPRPEPLDGPRYVRYAVINDGRTTVSGWRDRITLAVGDTGEILLDDVRTSSVRLAPGESDDTGYWLADILGGLPDGAYELTVQTNLDGYGQTSTGGFVMKEGSVALRAVELR